MSTKKGRKCGEAYNLYGFAPKVVGRKYVAVCLYCNRHMQNTAASRLKTHSLVCTRRKSENNDIQHEHKEMKQIYKNSQRKPAQEFLLVNDMNAMENESSIQLKIEQNSNSAPNDFHTKKINTQTIEAVESNENLYEEQIEYIQDYLKDNQNQSDATNNVEMSAKNSTKKVSHLKHLNNLQEEKMKAEIKFFRKKSEYYTQEMDNLKIERSLLSLQAKKLRLEIEKIQNDL